MLSNDFTGLVCPDEDGCGAGAPIPKNSNTTTHVCRFTVKSKELKAMSMYLFTCKKINV